MGSVSALLLKLKMAIHLFWMASLISCTNIVSDDDRARVELMSVAACEFDRNIFVYMNIKIHNKSQDDIVIPFYKNEMFDINFTGEPFFFFEVDVGGKRVNESHFTHYAAADYYEKIERGGFRKIPVLVTALPGGGGSIKNLRYSYEFNTEDGKFKFSGEVTRHRVNVGACPMK